MRFLLSSRKSPAILFAINSSIRKQRTAVTTTASSMMLKEMEEMTTAVVRLFLPKPASAIENGLKRLYRFFFFFGLQWAVSVYFTASIGETLPATFPGLRQLRKTVKTENTAPNRKIHGAIVGEVFKVFWLFACMARVNGKIMRLITKPAVSPIGMPMTDNITACRLISLRSCFLVVPIVFNNP